MALHRRHRRANRSGGSFGGGHLALLATDRLPGLGAVVGLAAVSDLADAYVRGLGAGAVSGLLGAGPPAPAVLATASPAHRPPPACPVDLIHGTADQAVPVAQSVSLHERWTCGRVRLTLVPEARHMHLVNPDRPAWLVVAAVLGEIVHGVAAGSSAVGTGEWA